MLRNGLALALLTVVAGAARAAEVPHAAFIKVYNSPVDVHLRNGMYPRSSTDIRVAAPRRHAPPSALSAIDPQAAISAISSVHNVFKAVETPIWLIIAALVMMHLGGNLRADAVDIEQAYEAQRKVVPARMEVVLGRAHAFDTMMRVVGGVLVAVALLNLAINVNAFEW